MGPLEAGALAIVDDGYLAPELLTHLRRPLRAAATARIAVNHDRRRRRAGDRNRRKDQRQCDFEFHIVLHRTHSSRLPLFIIRATAAYPSKSGRRSQDYRSDHEPTFVDGQSRVVADLSHSRRFMQSKSIIAPEQAAFHISATRSHGRKLTVRSPAFPTDVTYLFLFNSTSSRATLRSHICPSSHNVQRCACRAEG
ncbi:hypothetical protein sphantq_04170 [Sphingobium sp. AntQ-1]|nr:hypothetical protein sphantq_04170 [Sphingobium sp. AntQ-1]